MKTLNAVKLYKHTSTNVVNRLGDSYHLTEGFDDYDGYWDDGNNYELPEGYELSRSEYGEVCIYDKGGNHCEIIRVYNSPALVTVNDVKLLGNVK